MSEANSTAAASGASETSYSFDATRIDWDKGGGLVPAIVQDATSRRVLMLGYMDRDALAHTLATRRSPSSPQPATPLDEARPAATRSRSKRSVRLRRRHAAGPGQPRAPPATSPTSCFADSPGDFLAELDALVAARATARPAGSYTTSLFGRRAPSPEGRRGGRRDRARRRRAGRSGTAWRGRRPAVPPAGAAARPRPRARRPVETLRAGIAEAMSPLPSQVADAFRRCPVLRHACSPRHSPSHRSCRRRRPIAKASSTDTNGNARRDAGRCRSPACACPTASASPSRATMVAIAWPSATGAPRS